MNRSLLIVIVFALFGSMAGVTPVLAQESASPQPSVTTFGQGEASAPADSASLQFLIFSEATYYGGPPQAPAVEATPGAAARESVAPIVDAVAALDSVEDVAVVIPFVSQPYGGPSPMARIDVTVASPDQDALTELVGVVTQGTSAQRMLVGFIGARFTISDCQDLERSAREAALNEARSKAETQADLIGMELGDVIATRDVDTSSVNNVYGIPGSPNAGCDLEISSGVAGNIVSGATLPAFDPASQSSEVEVYRTIEVTFAVGAGVATPAA